MMNNNFLTRTFSFPSSKIDDEPPAKRRNTQTPDKLPVQNDRTCAQCGKSDKKLKHKQYCSKSCMKAAKASGEDKQHKHKGENGTSKSSESLPSPTSSSASTNGTIHTNGTSANGDDAKKSKVEPMVIDTPAVDACNELVLDVEETSYIVKWNVDDVCDFIRGLDNYSGYAEDFANHEIDGQALVLLNENHLVSTMNIKLGPALKIMSQIETLKKKSMEQQTQ